MNSTAIILLSGGLDSAVTTAIAIDLGFEVHALSFAYGQRHSIELAAARRVADVLGVARHTVIDIDLRPFGGSALTNDTIAVPRHDSAEQIDAGIPTTYVPARNTIFLSYALAYAETIPARDIFIGVNAQDHDGYPDCRPAYIAAFQDMARLATTITGLNIHTPLAHHTKADIIRRGLALSVDYALTHSCYDPTNTRPCRRCDACLLRAQGFAEVGVPDPALAASRW